VVLSSTADDAPFCRAVFTASRHVSNVDCKVTNAVPSRADLDKTLAVAEAITTRKYSAAKLQSRSSSPHRMAIEARRARAPLRQYANKPSLRARAPGVDARKIS
jgi:hypothetical protein